MYQNCYQRRRIVSCLLSTYISFFYFMIWSIRRWFLLDGMSTTSFNCTNLTWVAIMLIYSPQMCLFIPSSDNWDWRICFLCDGEGEGGSGWTWTLIGGYWWTVSHDTSLMTLVLWVLCMTGKDGIIIVPSCCGVYHPEMVGCVEGV